MFENYTVAVRIALVNHVSAGLLMLTKQFAQTDAAAAALQKRIDGIKATAMKGAFMVGGGAAMAAPFLYAIDKAAELQKQMLGIQVASRGTTDEMNSMRMAIEKIASQTVFSNIDVAKMGKLVATGTGLGAQDVTKLLPEYARFADVQYIMKGTGYDESVKDAIRLAHTAQHYDPESLRKYLDLLTKASFLVPGSLGEVGHALKYSQGIAKTALGVDDEQMVLMTALLNRLGFAGSRGGTNLIAAMTRTIPGIFGSGLLTGKSGEALKAMGFVDGKGHANVFNKEGKFDSFLWMGRLGEYVAREFAKNPDAIARQDIMKNFQDAFGAQGARVASLMSDPQAMDQLRKIGEAFQGYGGVQAIQEKFANESTSQQWMNAKTNFVSAMTELGYTLLPMATGALTKLNTVLGATIEFITKHQTAVKFLAYAFLGLAGAMMFGGTVLLLKAAFEGLALALGFARIGGARGIAMLATNITSMATAFGVFKMAAAVFMAAYLGWQVGGALKNSIDERLTAQNGGKPTTLGTLYYDRMHNADGSFRWKGIFSTENPAEAQKRIDDQRAGVTPSRPAAWPSILPAATQTVMPRATQQTVQVTTQINMDGRRVAEAVTQHQSHEANRPLAGATGYDWSMGLAPVGMGYGR